MLIGFIGVGLRVWVVSVDFEKRTVHFHLQGRSVINHVGEVAFYGHGTPSTRYPVYTLLPLVGI
jgi:hypothetical protein